MRRALEAAAVAVLLVVVVFLGAGGRLADLAGVLPIPRVAPARATPSPTPTPATSNEWRAGAQEICLGYAQAHGLTCRGIRLIGPPLVNRDGTLVYAVATRFADTSGEGDAGWLLYYRDGRLVDYE